MGKHLTEMSNEELWALFPIVLTEHNFRWKDHYKEERTNLLGAFGEKAIYRMSHIGSTSVPDLLAKPTVDILLEVFDDMPDKQILATMEAAGYLFSPQPDKPAPHMMFMKGYTEQGFADKVFHVHLRYPGDWGELYFRDWLKAHPEAVLEYGQLKQRLMTEHEHDRDTYTAQKSEFVVHITNLAMAEYAGRYAPAG